MVEQIGDYFARQRLLAVIKEELERRIDAVDMVLFLVESRVEFGEFVQAHQAAQKSAEDDIKATIRHVLDAQYIFYINNSFYISLKSQQNYE